MSTIRAAFSQSSTLLYIIKYMLGKNLSSAAKTEMTKISTLWFSHFNAEEKMEGLVEMRMMMMLFLCSGRAEKYVYRENLII